MADTAKPSHSSPNKGSTLRTHTFATRSSLDRSLGLLQVTASGVGIIVGAGVYVLVGEATEIAGPRVWMAFVAAAVLSALTALSYCELASVFPKAGGEFEYARHAYPRVLAFSVGWVMICGLTVAAAAVSLGFGRYVGQFVDIDDRVPAVALLLFVAGVAAGGIRQSARMTLVFSLVQVGGLLTVIAIGVPHLGDVDLLSGSGASGSVLGAAALVFFAFIGFDEVTTLSEETLNPSRTIPRALLLALGISTLLYVGVAIAAVSVIGASQLAASERPLADVLDHVLGGSGANVLAVIAMLATTNTTLLCVTAASRMQYGMAEAGALPRALMLLSPGRKSPHRAIALATVVAVACVLVKDLTLIASVTDFAVYLVFVAVNVAVVVLRFRRPELPRPFRTPGSIGKVPILPILGLMAVLVMLPSLRVDALLLGGGICAIGLVVDRVIARSQLR
jgi:basic amino acid/polyamine antiporter, APA family